MLTALSRNRYAHLYKFFAVAAFDGLHLLILVFQTQTVEHIKSPTCEIIGLLFESDGPTFRYGLFRVLTHQIRRIQGDLAPIVTLDGYHRRFRWWSGEAYWTDEDGNVEYLEHPDGYTQRFHEESGAFVWFSPAGTLALDEFEQPVWDTRGLGF